MNLKRTLTALIGLPIIIVLIVLGNKYILDVIVNIVAIICMYEYFHVIEKVAHPIKWIGYASTIIISVVSIIGTQNSVQVIMYGIPVILMILFLYVIISNMKTTFKDVAYTFLGIIYISFFFTFLSFMMELEYGKLYFAYTFGLAWMTDVFAYWIGRYFGKHTFSKVSPKKTIEGSLAGIISSIIASLIYLYTINRFSALDFSMPYAYIIFGVLALIFSVISQFGDFVASSIKRFADTKDYGNLLPGHGGMLDRVDSVIFLTPFIYFIASHI